MHDVKTLDAASSATFLVGLFLGVLPFPAKLFGFDPILAATTRLPDPWWWIVAGLVCVAAAATLETLDRAKKRLGG